MYTKVAVTTLEDFCLESLRKYIYHQCMVMARTYGGVEEDQVRKRELLMPAHINHLQDHIFKHVCHYMETRVVAVIVSGVSEAVTNHQLMGGFNREAKVFKTEMLCIVSMINIIISPTIRHLDMFNMAKILRSHLYTNFYQMSGLTHLNLELMGYGMESRSSSSNEFVAPFYAIKALECMPHLQYLCIPDFCTNNILRVLSTTCHKSLVSLIIENCVKITNDAVNYILKLNNLRVLGITGTHLSSSAIARLLFGLENLVSLPKGDFLCEAVESLVTEGLVVDSMSLCPSLPAGRLPELKIRDFLASEEYYFHSTRQMQWVHRICPFISKMRFFYDGEVLCELKVLERYQYLEDLSLNGGDFAKDPLLPLVENIGHRLTKLELNHVENIDRQVLVRLSASCPSLQYLSFSACTFPDYGALHQELFEEFTSGGLDTIEEIELALLLRDQEAWNKEVETMMVSFENLLHLGIHSQCSDAVLVLLLQHCPVLETLFIGTSTDISDQVLVKVLSTNALDKLIQVDIRNNEGITKYGLQLILSSCISLRRLHRLHCWKSLTEKDIAKLEKLIEDNNIDLDITEEKPKAVEKGWNAEDNMDEAKRENLRQFLSTD